MDITAEGAAIEAIVGKEDLVVALAQQYLMNPSKVRVEPTQGDGVFRITNGFDSILTDVTFQERLNFA